MTAPPSGTVTSKLRRYNSLPGVATSAATECSGTLPSQIVLSKSAHQIIGKFLNTMAGENAIRMSLLFWVIEIGDPQELPQVASVTDDDARQRATVRTVIAPPETRETQETRESHTGLST
jgi:hypothetical protein